MARNIARWLMLAAAGLATPSAATAGSTSTAPHTAGSVERECFAEGDGYQYCAELNYSCAPADVGCLIDDLSGALLRAQGNRDQRYAAYLARGIVSRRDNRIADALADFEAAQTLQPQLATPFMLIGQVYSDLGRFAQAVQSFDQADRVAPGLPTILLHRATARHLGGDSGGAIADLDRAITVMRSRVKLPEGADEPLEALLVARGEVRRQSGDLVKARSDFEAALTAKPGYEAARAALTALGK
jgi:tetratricopeptide (TPR) repeat protein